MADPSAADLQVEHLHVRFAEQPVLEDISFYLAAHSTLAIIGASGSGKTTLLRSIAGLTNASRGRVTLDNQPIDQLPVHQRGIVYLNQEPLLFPHLTLFDNIAFGVRLRRISPAVIRGRTEMFLTRLGLDGLRDRYPHALSGGERQRAAFGRALAVEPKLLLLDEPFSNLDPNNRTVMQTLFKEVSREQSITSLFVTHDLKECLRIGDRFAILSDGTLTLYKDKQAFLEDRRSGVENEMQFWRELINKDPDG